MHTDRIEILTERHLDGILTPEERVELNRLLRADRAAARRFVELSRMDNALYLHFRGARAESAFAASGAAPAFSRLRRTVDHVWGPAAAILIHAALFLVLLRWVIIPEPVRTPPLTVTLSPDPQAPLESQPWDAPATSGEAPETVPLPRLIPLTPSDSERWIQRPHRDVSLRLAPTAWEPAWDESLRPAWPDRYAGRLIHARRRRMERIVGDEAPAMEAAVEDALASLAGVQRPDGSWPATSDAPAAEQTALVLLSFLAWGHTPGSPLYGSVVEDGLRRLLRMDATDAGGLAADARLLALAEAFAINRLPALPPIIQAEAERLLASQRADGGWATEGESLANDALKVAWRVHALLAVRDAGLAPESLNESLARIVGYMKTRHDPARPRPGVPATVTTGERALQTAATLRVLQRLGEGRSPEARRCEVLLRRWVRELEAGEPWPLIAYHETALALLGATEPDREQARSVLRRTAARLPIESSALAVITLAAPFRTVEPGSMARVRSTNPWSVTRRQDPTRRRVRVDHVESNPFFAVANSHAQW